MNLQERQQFWQQQVNTWQTTGLSGAAFCKQQGLNYQQFIYWRKKSLTLQPAACQIIKAIHLVRVGMKTLWGSNEIHGITLPDAILVTECLDTGFSRNTGTSHHNKVLDRFAHYLLHLKKGVKVRIKRRE